MSGHQGWADLPDGLLHSIVALSGSFSGLLAFAATCRSWHAAFSSYPYKSTFSTLFQPLLLQPDVPLRSPRHHPFGHKHPCHVTDLASQHSRLCCQIPLVSLSCVKNSPPSPLGSFCFRGASYGQLVFSSNRSCLVVDVFTSISVSPPQLPGDKYTELCYCTLTAPRASLDSHLLVNTGSHSFFWHVGSHSWLRPSSSNGMIKQIVAFEGQVFGMDSCGRLFTVHLAPQICMQKMAVFFWESMSTRQHLARGDTFKAFCLDLSTRRAKWFKVEKLENWAIFISTNERSQPLSFMNPERWGGRSNCIYSYSHDSEHWTAFELGKQLQRDASSASIFVFISCGSMVQPIWVVPSMFSLCVMVDDIDA